VSEHEKHVRMNGSEFKKGWTGGLPETPCGYGSRVKQTRKQRIIIPEWIERYEIQSLADIGAGDLNWSKLVDFGCAYAAYDLVPRVSGVTRYDLISEALPAADCYMVIWVLNHLPANQCKIAMRKLLKSKARYLIMTHDPRMPKSTDIKPVESLVLRRKAEHIFELRLIRL